jgi:hypothetical protein
MKDGGEEISVLHKDTKLGLNLLNSFSKENLLSIIYLVEVTKKTS